MIMNEEKIEEAAENYVNSIVNQRDNSDYSQDVKNENARFDDYDIQSAFFSGANWALQNQWHDAKKELPNNSLPIIGINVGLYPMLVIYDHSNKCFKRLDYGEVKIDYWMPIPSLPTCSENKE